MASVHENAAEIARRFVEERRSAGAFNAYPGELPDSLVRAYAIQDEAIAEWGRPVLGWKVGRIAPDDEERYGAERLAGPIFDVVETADGPVPNMPVFARGFAAVEAEFLLRIGKAPPSGKIFFSLAETADLIGAVHLGIEVASSPLAPINDLGPAAIVSDFGNNNGLVVGPAIANWRTSGFEEWEVITKIDGVEVGRGAASSFTNGAIGSARFLFELMAKRGIDLAAGQWISSGAVTGVHKLNPNQTVEVRFDRWYEVRCTAVAAVPQ
jgi:2-keto-4-pentenoate hydratase